MRSNSHASMYLSPYGVLMLDKTGFITSANTAANELFDGFDFKNKKLHIDKLIGPSKSYRKDVCACDVDVRTGYKLEMIILKKEKDNVLVEMCIKRNLNGCHIGFLFDVTERNLDRAKLREMIRIQSHEVRAPLTNIIALVNLLDLDKHSRAVNRSLLAYLRTSAKQLDTVIRQIVQVATKVQPLLKPKLLLIVRFKIQCKKLLIFLYKTKCRCSAFCKNIAEFNH